MSDDNFDNQDPIKRKSRAGLSVKRVSLDKVHKKLMVVLERDTNHLLRKSLVEKLSRDESGALNNYLKLIKELRGIEKEKESELSEADLAEIAKQNEVEEEDENE
jgi:hypothetical protein